ncbi:ATPase [Allostella vacuolata]|nr:ATPase [Stella vacuolata]
MEEVLTFGPFRFLPQRNLLIDGDRPLRLGARALDILALLLERAGEVVPHDDIRARAWPSTFVDDTNLRVQIAALRKALGDGQGDARYILNLPGRGYRFVAEVGRGDRPLRPVDPAAALVPPPGRDTPAVAEIREPADTGLPVLLVRLIGRDGLIATVAERLSQRRLLTLVGPAGVGKTTVAVAAARQLAARFAGGACFVDLAPLTDPALVPGALASALRLQVPAERPIPALVERIRQRKLLVILDNCEHLVDAAAAIAEAILAGAPGVCVIATSREPLRAQGEWVQRLPSLELPPPGRDRTAGEAMAAPAVQLFVERAIAGGDGFELGDGDAPLAAEICRQLDGIPLAIELAAARVGQFGVRGLARALDDRFAVLRGGRRTAAPRHQTLRGALDWSFGILPEFERALLRRLSIFATGFSIDGAIAVLAGDGADVTELIEGVVGLAEKSLLAADISGDLPTYRLLQSTRAYALEKLQQSGEAPALRRRHAEHLVRMLGRAAAEWGVRPVDEWRAAYVSLVDEVRAALDWAFRPEGDAALGFALMAESGPLWFQASLTHEYRARLEAALAHPEAADALADRPRMRLQIALSSAIFNTSGPGADMAAASRRALELAERLGDADVQLQALWGLSGERYQSGDYHMAHALVERFGLVAAAAGDQAAGVVLDRMMALGLHLIGRHAEARRHAERAVRHPPSQVRTAQKSLYEYDNRVAARSHLARILWISGCPDQADAVAREGLEYARSLRAGPSRCYVLVFAACPVAFWRRDPALAGEEVRLLGELAADPSLAHWRSWAAGYAAALDLAAADGRIAAGRPAGGDGLGIDLTGARIGPIHLDMLGTLHAGLATPAAIDRAEQGLAPWCAPELIRAHGERLLRAGGADARPQAEAAFRRARALAAGQGALSWELRAATSLARLWHDRPPEARAALAPVVERLREGFATPDYRDAAGLLAELGH